MTEEEPANGPGGTPDSAADVTPDAVYAVPVDSVSWHSYVLSCPECGADRDWSLRVQAPRGLAGELAWAECPAGHRVNHPLVYPEFVHALFTWAQSPEPRPPLDDLLSGIRWEPHDFCWHNSEYSDLLSMTEWRPWSRKLPVAFRTYRGPWPELARTYLEAPIIATTIATKSR